MDINISEIEDFMPLDQAIYHIHVIHDVGVVYFENPKCGCTTIKKTLASLVLKSEYPSEYLHRIDRLPFSRPETRNGCIVIPDGYKTITSTRHPEERLISAYLNKIKKSSDNKYISYERQSLCKEFNIVPNVDISFIDFVRMVANQKIRNMNPHWRTQKYQTFNNIKTTDFILSLENLKQELSELIQEIYGQPSIVFDYLQENPGHSTNSASKRDQLITPEAMELIGSTYREDYLHFNYT